MLEGESFVVAVMVEGEGFVVVVVMFSAVQDGICALGKAHMRSTPSVRSFPNVAFETVSMFV